MIAETPSICYVRNRTQTGAVTGFMGSCRQPFTKAFHECRHEFALAGRTNSLAIPLDDAAMLQTRA